MDFVTQEANTVKGLDKTIAYLDQAISSQGYAGNTDVVILSDHGMLTVTPRNFIDLYKYIDKDVCKTYGTSPVLQVICQNGKETEACQNLTKAAEELKTFSAYEENEVLERWHVRNSIRFGPCVVVAKPYYAFQDMFELADWFFKEKGVKSMDTIIFF